MIWWHRFRQRPHHWSLLLLIRLIDHATSPQLRMQAMSLVYTTLIGLVPLLAASLALLKAFGIQQGILNPYLQQMISPLGEQGEAALQQVLAFVGNSEYGLLGIIGILALLYSAATMVSRVERCFNDAWRVASGRTILQRFTDFSGLILLTPLLLIAGLTMLSSLIGAPALQAIAKFVGASWLLEYASSMLPWLSLLIAFSILYFFIPNTQVKPWTALIGGAITAIVWQATGSGFRAIVGQATEQSTFALYSGFAVLMMFFIWLYISWMIILLGAHLVFYLQHRRHLNRPMHPDLSISDHYQQLLACYRDICRQYLQRQPARHFDGPALSELEEAGLISQTKKGDWLPCQPLDELTLAQLRSRLIGDDVKQDKRSVKTWLNQP